jgi:MFS family permease
VARVAEALLSVDGGVWAPQRRRLTLGLVLTVTLVAFESLAISTVLPVVSDDLGGLDLYGWVFRAFFLGSLLGIVTAGRLADREGTALPFALGLALFAGGLVVGGLAPTMGVLVAGRAAQGVGAGAIPAVAYVSVSRAYPSALRPRVFAIFSSAWVIPGLIGPAASSGIAHLLSWRWVFLALLPFVALAAAIALPALVRSVGPIERAELSDDGNGDDGDSGNGDSGDRSRTAPALALIAGTAAVLAAVGGVPRVAAVPLALAGAPVAFAAFVRLVPEGTLRLAPGIPAAGVAKGILTFAFFGADAYVSLLLQDVRDQDTWVAGVALTITTVTWTAGAWVAERWIHQVGPRRVARTGLVLVAVGVALLFGALGPLPVALATAVWSVAGFGIGLAYSTISVVVLGLAAPGHEGAASAALQLCDVLGTALGTGLVGATVALAESNGWPTASGLRLGFTATLVAAALGALAARRLPTELP